MFAIIFLLLCVTHPAEHIICIIFGPPISMKVYSTLKDQESKGKTWILNKGTQISPHVEDIGVPGPV